MVVDEDPERRHRWCTVLVRHALSVHGVCPAEAASAARQWPGVILLSDGAQGPVRDALRAVNPRVPILLLPRDASDDAIVAEVERWVKAIPQSVDILMVDDEPKWRTILQNYLELKGFTVLTAGSGEEALAHLERAEPLACLLDIKMPGLDGLATLKRLRASHPSLPVIFLTQVDEEQTAEEAKVLGAHDYLVKPFISFEQLEVLLRAKLGR